MTETKFVSMFPLERHAHRPSDPDRCFVSRKYQTYEALEVKNVSGMFKDCARRLSGKALSPPFLGDKKRKFYFLDSFNLPRQQAAPTEKRSGALLDGGPEPQLVALGMAVAKVVQLFLGLCKRSRSVWKIATNLGVTIERKECIKVGCLKMTKYKPLSFEDDHRCLRRMSL
jgi:hypothetical protein